MPQPVIPFSLLPPPLLEKIAKTQTATRIGNVASTFYTHLGEELIQTESVWNAREYMSRALVAMAFNFVVVLAGGLFLAQVTKQKDLYTIAPAAAVLLALVSLVTILSYPKIISRKRAR